jgi:hypothetical protein
MDRKTNGTPLVQLNRQNSCKTRVYVTALTALMMVLCKTETCSQEYRQIVIQVINVVTVVFDGH